MTAFSSATSGKPHGLPFAPAVRCLDVVGMREVVEAFRRQHVTQGGALSVIEVSARKAGQNETLAAAVDRLLNVLHQNWAHEKEVGWLDEDHLGIALPNTALVDASDYCRQLCAECELDPRSVCVYGPGGLVKAPGPVRTRPLEQLFVLRMPVWKRTFDLGGAAILLMFSAPLLFMAALAVKLTSRGPAFFRQQRVGKGGRPFPILKLRTMCHDADLTKEALRHQNEQDGLAFKISDDPRVTSVGRFLRRTSLDELPQLINVLKGEMSLVGPRPLPASDWHPDDGWFCRRHDVTPGMTCIWQVSGRSEVSFEDWMQMDAEYVDHCSFWLDTRLLLRTLPAVLSQRGAS